MLYNLTCEQREEDRERETKNYYRHISPSPWQLTRVAGDKNTGAAHERLAEQWSEVDSLLRLSFRIYAPRMFSHVK